MSVKKSEIEALQQWLAARLPGLVAHGEKVRQLLNAVNGSEKIIESATDLVKTDTPSGPPLTPQQMAVWKKLIPILAEHGLLAVKGGGPALPSEDKPLTKEEAAEYLGFSVSKLNRCMKKRQIQYEKFGTGRTATVRFRRAELQKYRQSRNVAARTTALA
jgi:excisionase family DNA binding protein